MRREEEKRKKEGKFCSWFFISHPSSLILLLLFFLHPPAAHADKIHLKDGKVYEGKLVGKSEKRYLFSVDFSGVSVDMSFFPENIEHIELGKDTVESQIPYLKDVETTKMGENKESASGYQISLYKESPGGGSSFRGGVFTENEMKTVFSKEEFEYYQKFNEVLRRYTDRMSFVQNVYMNLTTATKEDLAKAKDYMDGLYFELNSLLVPEIFRPPHAEYLAATKASYLSFSALEQGLLDEASRQNKLSEDGKQGALLAFRDVILKRREDAQATAGGTEKALPPPKP